VSVTMNGPTRKKLFQILVSRDGQFCKGCGALASEKPLVIDHRDNNNRNNDLSNLQILCRSCNYQKNPRRPVDMCVSEEESPDQSELEVSRTKEPSFRKFVCHQISEEKSIPEQELINSGSEYSGISPVTAKRYLNKMCSKVGIYQRRKIGRTVIVEYKIELDFL